MQLAVILAALVLVVLMGVLAVQIERRRVRREVDEPLRRLREWISAVEAGITDANLAACWAHLVPEMLSVAGVERILASVEAGRDLGMNDFGLEIFGDVVEIRSGLGPPARCARQELLRLLRELSTRVRDV